MIWCPNRCSFCGGDVKEDPNHMPKADSRLLVAKFNQIMEPLWLLLKDVEDIRLSSDLLEPEIQVTADSGPQSQANAGNHSSGRQWTDKNRAINSEYENSVLNDQKNYTIKIEDSSGDGVDGGAGDREMIVVKKEQPSWMLESTVSNINHTINSNHMNDGSTPQNSSSKPNNKYMTKTNSVFNSSFDNNEPSKEILETLLIHEKQLENSSNAVSLLLSETTNHLSNNYNNDNNDDVIMSDEEEDEVDGQQPMVIVGHQSIPLSEVNDEIIAQMSEEEKEEYIRLSQQVYAHMYDI
jgi:transcription initiation factor TFIIE subunit alpha